MIFILLKLGRSLFHTLKYLRLLALLLVVIGGLCWLLLGAGYDALTRLFGGGILLNFSYLLLGFAAVYWAIRSRKYHRYMSPALSQISMILLMVSGLCWFLKALGYDLIARLIGPGTIAVIAYVILGLASLFWLVPAYQRYEAHKRRWRLF